MIGIWANRRLGQQAFGPTGSHRVHSHSAPRFILTAKLCPLSLPIKVSVHSTGWQHLNNINHSNSLEDVQNIKLHTRGTGHREYIYMYDMFLRDSGAGRDVRYTYVAAHGDGRVGAPSATKDTYPCSILQLQLVCTHATAQVRAHAAQHAIALASHSYCNMCTLKERQSPGCFGWLLLYILVTFFPALLSLRPRELNTTKANPPNTCRGATYGNNATRGQLARGHGPMGPSLA
eukprot:1147178-Pelagomonas_calceolata.AAC.1